MELFLRGSSAREAFGRLNSGARLEISATSRTSIDSKEAA